MTETPLPENLPAGMPCGMALTALEVEVYGPNPDFEQIELFRFRTLRVQRLLFPPKRHRQRAARKPTLESVRKQAIKAGIEVARYEIKCDSIAVIPGKSEPAEPDNPWPLDEFRTKEIKQ